MKGRKVFDLLVNNWPAKVLSLVAAIVLFLSYRIGTLEERYFSVPLEIMVDQDFLPSSPYPRTARVNVRGRSDDIFRILEGDIVVYADLSDHTREGVFRTPVIVEKTGTARNFNIELRVDPMEVTVELERKVRRSVDVFPAMTGSPARGYELSAFYISPTSVEVQGPASHIGDLTALRTEEIDLSGKDGTFTSRVRLSLTDAYIHVIGSDVIEFTGIIDEIVLLRRFEGLGVVLIDLLPALRIDGQLPDGAVRVQGSELFMERIRPDQILLTADCSQIESPGTYRVELTPDVPSGLIVLDYDPAFIDLVVVGTQRVGP